MIIRQRITIVNIRKPQQTLNDELQWFGEAMGLFSMRDKDRSCFRIFIELLKAAKQNMMLTSDEIALRTHLTRGTAVHHLHKLMESGIVISSRNRYALRVDNLEVLVDEVESDLKRMCNNLRAVAKEIDTRLGL